MPTKVGTNTVQSKNPRTGLAVGEFVPTPVGNIAAIVRQARNAFENWSRLSSDNRLKILGKAYREFYSDRDELAELISAETGKPLNEAYSSEIIPILDCFKYFIKNTKRFLKPMKIQAQNPLFKLRKGFVSYEPLGIVAVISPWNYPFLLSMQHIIPALLAGNTIVHKPSEFTSLVSLKIQEIFDRASLPDNVFQVVTGFADIGQALVEAQIDKIFFTGSTAVGKKIYRAASASLTPVNMELGGSDPMIVLDDADLERTLNAALWGAFGNAGQACVSVERLLIHESIFTIFIDRLAAKARELKFASPKTDGHDISCLINETQFRKIETLVRDAQDKGIVMHLGGNSRHDLGDLYFEPTILSKPDASMHINEQEIFGPVVVAIPFVSDEKAVALANDSEFGLSASVWSRNRHRAIAVAERLQSGSVLINDLQSHLAQFEAPYLGHKQSGLGVSHGHWGMMEMVRPKFVSTDRPAGQLLLSLFAPHLKRNNVWWFPYSKQRVADFKVFSAFLHNPSWLGRIKAIPGTLKAIMRK